MKNVVLQDTLTFETFSPGEVWNRALKLVVDVGSDQGGGGGSLQTHMY